jgi:hypothetical protein
MSAEHELSRGGVEALLRAIRNKSVIITVPRTVVLDTAALATHLACTPAYVRLLVSEGIITAMGRRALAGKGRPTMWFDVDAVEAALRDASDAGRVTLDNGPKIVRKSRIDSPLCRRSRATPATMD